MIFGSRLKACVLKVRIWVKQSVLVKEKASLGFNCQKGRGSHFFPYLLGRRFIFCTEMFYLMQLDN